MPKVSIIVPVFNTDKYLRTCINSILNQTLKDIEIILVDDGSNDSSSFICEEYAFKYSKVQVLHIKNGGVSIARNIGMNYATGEYIGFVDSDDYIAPDMYEKLYYKANENDCSVVSCNYRYTKNEQLLDNGQMFVPVARRIGRDEIRCLMSQANEKCILWFCWNKLYRREMLQNNKIHFETGLRYGEDSPFNMEAMLCSNGIIFIDSPLYYYNMRDDSAMHTKYKSQYLMQLEMLYDKKMSVLKQYEIVGGGIAICISTLWIIHCRSCLLTN